jgi:hypothetical protein
MSNGNRALPLALGAGGGFLLWYFLRDHTQDTHVQSRAVTTTSHHPSAPAPSATAAPPAAAAPSIPVAPSAPAVPSPGLTACAIRLDATGLTADGQRVGVAEAVNRCKVAGRADVTVSPDAPGAVYADLMIALSRASVATSVRRNSAGPRNARPRIVGPRTVEDVDLPSFAMMVEALAADIEPDPTPEGLARGRFGDRKVFIAAIRRALRATKYASLSRTAIDELLFRAHRERLLVLERADFVAAMDPVEVRDSEFTYGGIAQFHFVVVEPDTARNASTHRAFTLVTYAEGRKAGPHRRWFLADPPTTWADARDRLETAGFLDRNLAGRTSTSGGWMLSVDPTSFRDELAEPLPGGGSRDER